jgi:hypothetical protein
MTGIEIWEEEGRTYPVVGGAVCIMTKADSVRRRSPPVRRYPFNLL